MTGLLSGRTVVVAGATGMSGRAACRELLAAGATVVALGSSSARLAELAAALPGLTTNTVDLGSAAATVEALASLESVDGLVHLVGGWRGGGGLTGQSEEDWTALSGALIDTLRHTTIALHDRLVAAPVARVVIVSAAGLDRPTAGNANYLAAKAAAEVWLQAVDQSLGRNGSPDAAAVALVVKAFVDDAGRAAQPEKDFAGWTDVDAAARQIVELFTVPAAELPRRIRLDKD